MQPKPIFFTSIFFILFTLNIAAQRIEFGVLTGPSINMFSGDYRMNEFSSPKTGFSAGASFHYIFGRFSLGTNVLFERRGEQYRFLAILPDNYIDIEQEFDYLTVPILLGYKIDRNKNLRINFGCYYSYLLNEMQYAELNGEFFNSRNPELWNSLDLGILGSVDYNISITNNLCLNIEARANFGIVDIHKQNDEQGTDFDQFKQEMKNQSLLLLLGFNYLIE